MQREKLRVATLRHMTTKGVYIGPEEQEEVVAKAAKVSVHELPNHVSDLDACCKYVSVLLVSSAMGSTGVS